MIELKLDVDVMGTARFAVSPLAETVASVRVLVGGRDPRLAHLHRPWAALARRGVADQDLALLRALAPPGTRHADFLHPPAATRRSTIEDQLEQLRQLPAERIREEVEWVWSQRELPRAAQQLIGAGERGPEIIAEALRAYWDAAISPYWSRMSAVLEEDVAHRAAQATRGGLFELLEDLHPEISIEGHTLRIAKPHHAARTYEGAQLTLVPSVFIWPCLLVAHHLPGRVELTYGARGVGRVWEGLVADHLDDHRDDHRDAHRDHLGALLGRGRAAVLAVLAVPMSTTQVARRLRQSAGSVSRHLAVLRASGLVVSWRSGRSVLYAQTPLAQALSGVDDTHRIGRGRPGAGSRPLRSLVGS
ncbi:DUF5937 family protein [Intrasporangium sp. DVR]|uniref:ArsR/SmtB family transcription factor n=1 Tax=Intrasporangium sp. DVR TaxID=3127867 RepID=UPI00313A4DE3